MNELISYQSINGLQFGDPPKRADELFGNARLEKHNREGELEKHYDEFILRFTPETNQFRECTVPFNAPTSLNGVALEWSVSGLQSLCKDDGEPMEFYGSIVLFSKGVSLTGLEEGAESDRSITIFSQGDWDGFRSQMTPVVLS